MLTFLIDYILLYYSEYKDFSFISLHQLELSVIFKIIKNFTVIGSSKEYLLYRELLVGEKQSINSRTRPGVFMLKLSRYKRQLPL